MHIVSEQLGISTTFDCGKKIELDNEFKQTKELIIELTRHIDNVEASYNIVNNELNSRYIK